MIRRFSRILNLGLSCTVIKPTPLIYTKVHKISTAKLCTRIHYKFSNLPKHQVLNMPALSPTMSEGKIVKWNKKIGDAVEEGDILCQVQTDKATVGFEVTQKGFLAQKRDTDKPVPVGTPLVVVVKKKQDVQSFGDFKFDSSASSSAKPSQSKQAPKQSPKSEPKQQKSQQKSKPQASTTSSYPKHQQLKMPALSPTMSEGKIVKWNIKQGQQYSQGDSLCDIETDKATVAFEATQKGVLAKIIAKQNSQMKVGDILGVSVKKKQDAGKFADYKAGSGQSKPAQKTESKQTQKQSKSETPQTKSQEGKSETKSQGGRVFASPAAKTLATSKGVNLEEVGKGSGPNGRIIRQDVQSYKPAEKKAQKQQKKETASQSTKKQPSAPPKAKAPKIQIPQNPFQQIPLSNMRKTIAARLTQSKSTIPHYYIQSSIEMDKANALRNQLNLHEKQNGVKISVNDIIVKAMALALRDYPGVNAQWHGNVVKKFKYADVSVAVATQGGLITPIVYRADTLGLLDIARRTKDIAKRAREGKLDPREYIGGTTTVSNIGMFGIDSVTSVINPPQSTIVGVGKTQKKILFDQNSKNPQKPYRVAQVMQVIVSADHRVVDGAVAAQWLSRIKKYLENPSHMLL